MSRNKVYKLDEFERKVEAYFEHCEAMEKPCTITGLSVYLGICRTTLWNYSKLEGFKEVFDFAKLRCENDIEEGALMGKYNATSCIFNLKNNYGWKDKQEVETTVNVDKFFVDEEEE